MKLGNTGVLITLAAAAGLAYIVRDHLTTPFDSAFEARGKAWGVPPNLLRAIGHVESRFNAAALDPASHDYPNGTRDVGVMQINSATGQRYGYSREDLRDPLKNIDAAAHYLDELKANLGARLSSYTWPAAYNVGPDLLPHDRGVLYASSVLYHWQLYDLGRMFA